VGGNLGSNKGINLPDKSITAPILSEKDKADLAFGLKRGVDYVAISFVRNAEDVKVVRQIIDKAQSETQLIAKIEKHEAMSSIDEILPWVDGLMVARGDLGVEIPIERIPRAQKMLIAKANAAGKPVITATQMLMSMVSSPRPTRAEVNDVANAILDGSDAVMLSEESAIGQYPIEAVNMLHRIACHMEAEFPFTEWRNRFDGSVSISPQEAVASAACSLAQSIDAAAIASSTMSGSTTRMVAKYRPQAPIITLTPNKCTYQRMALVWGAVPLLMKNVKSDAELERQCLELLGQAGFVKKGDSVVITAGMPLNVTGTTNLIRIVTV
jgi:pyruvate kinase